MNMSRKNFTFTPIDSTSLAQIFDHYQKIMLYTTHFITVIGLVGNTLTFAVFTRCRFKTISFAFYSKAMVITDSIYLLRTFVITICYQNQVDLNSFSDITCKFSEYIDYVCVSISCWILTLITFDRTLVIIYPRRFEWLRKKKVQMAFVLIVYIFSVALYVISPLSTNTRIYTYRPQVSSNQTKTSCFHDKKVVNTLNIISFVNTIIPTVFINNIMAIVLIFYIFKSRQKVNSTNVSNTNNTFQRRRALRDRRFAINTLALNLLSVVGKSPFFIFNFSYFNLFLLDWFRFFLSFFNFIV
jgi:hypothetical protein